MKYLITENKLKSLMFEYILNLFEHNDRGELNWTYGEDEFGDENGDRMYFYFGNWGNQDVAFEWVNEGEEEKDYPILYMDNDLKKELDLTFSDKWVDTFKEFVKHNYGITFNTLSDRFESWETNPDNEDDEEFDDEEFDLDGEN